MPPGAQYSAVTVTVAPGETRDIEFIADNPGDWAFHSHKAHHTMNQMQHDMPNLTGIDKGDIEDRIKLFFPGFMGLMNINGMGEMFEMYGSNSEMGKKMKLPLNLSPIGSPGPFGVIEMGGMFTVLKVREGLTSYVDPGWYKHPKGTVAESIHEESDSGIPSGNQESKFSWFSMEENERAPKNVTGMNWMESKPEDSMSGHMHHKGD